MLDKFSEYLEPQDEEGLSAARLKLVQAGYRSASAVQTMNFAKMMMGVGFLAVGVLYIMVQPGEPSMSSMLMTILIPGGVGYMLPSYWVERRLQQRQEDVTNGFPDSLDLMLVCVEAGQSLDQAILRVAKETKASSPTLAEEFEVVANEMRAGKDRVTVLRDMAERCGVNDISSFVTVLVQSANFGTSISDALRVYADEMRDKRVLRAEEKANVLPTKLTIGTMLFTVPPLLIIMVGPSIYDIYVNLLGETF
jgi:tight adherence protein C